MRDDIIALNDLANLKTNPLRWVFIAKNKVMYV